MGEQVPVYGTFEYPREVKGGFNVRREPEQTIWSSIRRRRSSVGRSPNQDRAKTDLNTLREIFLEVGLLLKDVGCTTIMTTEIVEGSGLISRYGIEEFLATGVMVLSLVRQSSPIRKLFVRKMRGTSHSLNDYAFAIGPDGIVIKGPVGVRSVSQGRRRLHTQRRKRRSR